MAEKIIERKGAEKEIEKKNAEAVREQIEALKTIRDELRVQAHLANLEAKEAWGRLEPHFDSLIYEAQKAGHVTVSAVSELMGGFKRFMGAVKYERNLREKRPGAHA